VAVLMNLTHEHADGVEKVAQAGGMEAVAGLLWTCCTTTTATTTTTTAIAVTAPPPVSWQRLTGEASQPEVMDHDHGGDDVGGSGGYEGMRRTASRTCILRNLKLVNVCLGLLINLTSSTPDRPLNPNQASATTHTHTHIHTHTHTHTHAHTAGLG
jgi:hypothetical protein